MTALPHLLVGALVGSFFPNPFASGVAGFVTHSLVDGIPHWDPPFFRGGSIHKRAFIFLFLLTDACVASWILYSLRSLPSFFWGGVGGMILDLEYFVVVPLRLKAEV